ncbi:HNH endonuclease signature motif containing protein [Microbacterium sp.]|uniref:HNH endonuclease signature motif containing protein n=1 Tax=Microbacterium sp. TaxID=51671 RepID=UPI0025FF5C18|nr:HNH endonuclease signature motif containing protein [Microbacterium sp.]MBT9608148.1 DUF222 domain-containing protein [Microbacterium sp.]
MGTSAPLNGRSQPAGPWRGVPWPTDDEVQAEADTTWAVELGLLDGGETEQAYASPAASSLDALLDDLENRAAERHRATAAEYGLIRRVLRDAAFDPVPWVGPDPTLDLAWSDARGRTVAAVRRDRRDMAERAAVAEIAVRLRLSEQTIRARASHAEVPQARCPRLWRCFTAGWVSERHAVETARLAASLPDEPPSWALFDEGARERAFRLTPARFAVSARALRETVHAESLEVRHRRAVRERGVWLTPELDGMATLNALLPADRAHAAMAHVDRAARHLRTAPDEERALAELRADVFADLLTVDAAAAGRGVRRAPEGTAGSDSARAGASGSATGAPAGDAAVTPTGASAGAPTGASTGTPSCDRGADAGPRPGRATVVLTVPALTLLGAGTESATLDGYGPIDLDTARRLAGEASSWIRVLTHPVTAVPIALDRATYRVPAALRRWLGVTSPTCVFPGCGRPARECDLDHLQAWSEGGGTDDENLEPECRHHHRIRHETLWRPARDPDRGDLRWISPLGTEVGADPPPF